MRRGRERGPSKSCFTRSYWARVRGPPTREASLDVNPDAFRKMDPRDAALLVASRYPCEADGLRTEIAASFVTDRYSLTQALLATLHIEQALTTNFDTLYERAYAADPAAAALHVLPRQPPSATGTLGS